MGTIRVGTFHVVMLLVMLLVLSGCSSPTTIGESDLPLSAPNTASDELEFIQFEEDGTTTIEGDAVAATLQASDEGE
jgi:hypothetical protein